MNLTEETTAQYTGQLVDETGANLGLSSIGSLTLTLYDKASGTIINSRNSQNVLNQNNVTVSSTGFVTWQIQPGDNVILDDTLSVEVHIALFVLKWGAPEQKLNHPLVLSVANIAKTP